MPINSGVWKMHCNEKESNYFTEFFKPTAAILPAVHEVKQRPLSRTFRHCACAQ